MRRAALTPFLLMLSLACGESRLPTDISGPSLIQPALIANPGAIPDLLVIRSEVQALFDAGVLHRGQVRRMFAALDGAVEAITADDAPGASLHLRDFVAELDKWVRSGHLSASQRQGFFDALTAIYLGIEAFVAFPLGELSVPVGFDAELEAVLLLGSGGLFPITSEATWSVDDETIASIDGNGRLHGISAGTVVVSAYHPGTGLTGVLEVMVRAAAVVDLDVTPTQVELPLGLSTQLHATARLDDGTVVPAGHLATWASSDPTTVWVNDDAPFKGRVTALSPGSADITATLDGVSGTRMVAVGPAVLVGILLDPMDPSVSIADGTLQLSATGELSDGSLPDITGDVAWTNSDPNVATVSSTGLVTLKNTGVTVVTASLDGIARTTMITVF